jgi:hypothetical protein
MDAQWVAILDACFRNIPRLKGIAGIEVVRWRCYSGFSSGAVNGSTMLMPAASSPKTSENVG